MNIQKKSKRVAWITGASSGIGRELSKQLSSKGWKLALTARNIENLKSLADEMSDDTLIVPADVSNKNEIQTAYKEIIKKFKKIDLCILNAGIYNSVDALNIDSNVFKKHMDINYMGVVYPLEFLIPHFLKNKMGHISIISSPTGWRGLPLASAYGPSKAALINLAQSLRYQLEPNGIKIQIISPGFVLTNATPVNEHKLPGIISSELAAKKIIKALNSGSFETIVPNYYLLWLMYFLKFLPENIAYKIIKWKTGY